MPLLPYNSIGGYAIGFTASTVIDSNGNIFAAGISAAGATFSGLARFNAGISAAGATLSSNITIPSGSTLTVSGNFVANGNVNLGDATTDSITVAGLLSANSGISAAGSTFYGAANFFANPPTTNSISLDTANRKITVGHSGRSLSLSFPTTGPLQTPTCSLPIVETVLAGLSAAQTFTNTNTFNTLTNFPGGISAAGATFGEDIAVNGGDITTTATTASLFNANATTLNILNTQSSGFTLNIGTASTFSGSKNINIGGNLGGGASENIRIGISSSSSRVSILGGITLGGTSPAGVVVAAPSSFTVQSNASFITTASFGGLATFNTGISAAGATFSGLARFNAGISAAGGITFNSNVTINDSNTLNVSTILSSAASGGRISIGDYDGVANGTHIFVRDNVYVLDIGNPYGQIKIGDPQDLDTGNYIYYYAGENRLSTDTSSNITGFGSIYALTGFYETANEIRVTNNARSWFL